MKKVLAISILTSILILGCGSTDQTTGEITIEGSLDGGLVVSSAADVRADINQTNITDILFTCIDQNDNIYYYSGYFTNCTNSTNETICYNFAINIPEDQGSYSCLLALTNGTPINQNILTEEDLNNTNATIVSVLPEPLELQMRYRLRNRVRVRLRLKAGDNLTLENISCDNPTELETKCCNTTDCKLNSTDIETIKTNLKEFIKQFKEKIKIKLKQAWR